MFLGQLVPIATFFGLLRRRTRHTRGALFTFNVLLGEIIFDHNWSSELVLSQTMLSLSLREYISFRGVKLNEHWLRSFLFFFRRWFNLFESNTGLLLLLPFERWCSNDNSDVSLLSTELGHTGDATFGETKRVSFISNKNADVLSLNHSLATFVPLNLYNFSELLLRYPKIYRCINLSEYSTEWCPLIERVISVGCWYSWQPVLIRKRFRHRFLQRIDQHRGCWKYHRPWGLRVRSSIIDSAFWNSHHIKKTRSKNIKT